MKHVWHECEKENCMVCKGDLSLCTVCGQAEGTLEDVCLGPQNKKVKVKIAVTVDYKGNWGAHGWGKIENFNSLSREDNEALMMEMAVENLGDGENRYWVTATLDIPENKEVEEIKAEEVEVCRK